MQQESEKQRPPTPEEVEKILKDRKKEIELKSKFYKETEEFYTAQLKHETILTQIEEQKYKRLEMKVRFAQFVNPPDQNTGKQVNKQKENENSEQTRENK